MRRVGRGETRTPEDNARSLTRWFHVRAVNYAGDKRLIGCVAASLSLL
jgi:hypothetical protein